MQVSERETVSRPGILSIEDIAQRILAAGLEYAGVKAETERQELLRPCVKATIMRRLEEGEKLSEARLTRLAEADGEYILYLERLAETRGRCEKLRIRYE